MKKYLSVILVVLISLVVGCSQESEDDGPVTIENMEQPQIESLEDGANPDLPGAPLGETVLNAPDTGLVNQFGEPVSFESLPTKPIFVGFIYTRCPDAQMCPLITQKMQRVQRQLKKDSVEFVSVTFDPEYDTPAVLKKYGDQRSVDYQNWDFWTGDPRVVNQLVEHFGIHTKKAEDQIVHNLRIYLIDSSRTVRFWYRGTDWTVEDVVERLRNL